MERVSTSETSELYLVQDGEEVRLDSLEATARTNISECASVHKGICDLKANGSSFSFNFVGIFLAKSTPFFVFPKCFSFSTDKKSGNLADSARLLYKVLSRYKQDGKYRREAELYLAGSSSTLSNQIDAALHILKDYKENCSFESWCYRIAANVCLDFLRKRKNDKAESLEPLQEQGYDPPDPGLSPEETVVQSELRSEIREAILDLPPDQRDALGLTQLENKDYSEAALILGVSEGTVKSRVNRAREKLRNKLSDRNSGPPSGG